MPSPLVSVRNSLLITEQASCWNQEFHLDTAALGDHRRLELAFAVAHFFHNNTGAGVGDVDDQTFDRLALFAVRFP